MNSHFNILDEIKANFDVKKVGVTEFVESAQYCGKKLYPGQRLLLKLIFLEELTDFEETLLDKWIAGGRKNTTYGQEIQISPLIRDRVAWLRENGYPHFSEITLVGGRRGSKGFITSSVLAKKMFDLVQIPDPNSHYGIDLGKEIYFTCVAAAEAQAKDLQYADLAGTISQCKALNPYVFKLQEKELSLMTRKDLQEREVLQREGKRVQRDTSKVRARAAPANSATLRGYTSMAFVFDEFAHFMQGESNQADEKVYEAARPSLAQFGADAITFCNSSPYSKVGKFYERWEEAMEVDNDKPFNPTLLGIRFPSWALYEGWWDDPDYHGMKKSVMVSPDWDRDEKKEDGEYKYTRPDRLLILDQVTKERKNPDTYKVEYRSVFAEVIDSYLDPLQVDRMFQGRPIFDGGFEELKTNWGTHATSAHRYKAHLDPSSTTAGFGFAMSHVEYLEGINGVEPHVIFDIIKRWEPHRFKDGVINWETVINEVFGYIRVFRPYEITFDQFQSAAPMQQLRNMISDSGIEDRIEVREVTATNEVNWKRAEIFKTALYQGLVHGPQDTQDNEWAGLELKYLTQTVTMGKYPRIDKQDIGPVQTKDMADCIMECVNALIGNTVTGDTRARLFEDPFRVGGEGGYSIGKHEVGRGNSFANHPAFAEHYGRSGEQSFPGQRRTGKDVPNVARPWGISPTARSRGRYRR